MARRFASPDNGRPLQVATCPACRDSNRSGPCATPLPPNRSTSSSPRRTTCCRPRSVAATLPRARTTSSTSTCPRRRCDRYVRAGRAVAPVDRRRRARARRRTVVHGVPDALHRRRRLRPRPRRRRRCAGGGRRRCRRGAPPRAHDAEGVDRSSRPDAGDAGEPLPGVGPLARRRAERTARRARRAGGRGDRRRRRPSRRADHRCRRDSRRSAIGSPATTCSSPTGIIATAWPDLPRRGPRRRIPDRRRCRRCRADAGIRRRARRRTAQRRGDPPAVLGCRPTTTWRRRSRTLASTCRRSTRRRRRRWRRWKPTGSSCSSVRRHRRTG